MRAVVLAKRNTPVMTVNAMRWGREGCQRGWRYANGVSVWGRRTGGDRKCALTAEIGHLDHPPCEERARHADHTQNDLLRVRIIHMYAAVSMCRLKPLVKRQD